MRVISFYYKMLLLGIILLKGPKRNAKQVPNRSREVGELCVGEVGVVKYDYLYTNEK